VARSLKFFRVAAMVMLALAPGAHAELPSAEPASLGFDAERLKRIDTAIDGAIERGQVPGAVVLVGRRGFIAYAHAAGRRVVGTMPVAMTRDTVFDMASITKPVATATSVMILIEEGKIRLTDRLGRALPEFDNHGKGGITIDQLLRHRAGLIPDNAIADYQQGPEAAWKKLAELDLVAQPDERFIYSDVGFQILGRLVEKTSGQRLDRFAAERIFNVLGMTDAHFRRLEPSGVSNAKVPLERIAPTEPESKGGQMLRGVVHDPRSRALGGVADLCSDATQRRSRSQRPAYPLAAGGEGHGRRGRDAAEPASGTRMGRSNGPERHARRLIRAHKLRPHRVHRDESVD
jgi:CubicO group peptidase (beta-lactamase class C family)